MSVSRFNDEFCSLEVGYTKYGFFPPGLRFEPDGILRGCLVDQGLQN